MTTLHIINKPPSNIEIAERCFRFATQGDAILLIEDAVYFALPTANAKLKELNATGAAIFALKEDLLARGVLANVDDIITVSYDRFVELSATYDKSASWY